MHSLLYSIRTRAGVVLLIVGVTLFSFALVAYAVSYGGWAWGGTPGPSGASDAYQGLGWVSFNYQDIAGATVQYGVDIPSSDGDVTGYAWSSDYGWLSFEGADLVGCVPALTQARRVGDNIVGGARWLAIKDEFDVGNAGGYDGCVSLNGSAADSGSYGSSVTGDGSLAGYIWSSDLGYINVTGVHPLDAGRPTAPVITPNPVALDIDEVQTFTFYSEDPNGDDVEYQIDWDNDGSVDATSGYMAPGVGGVGGYDEDQTWASDGDYDFRAKAVDDTGVESVWAYASVTIGAGELEGPVSCSPSSYTNATLCSGDDTGFAGTLPSRLVGSGGCTAAVKCQYQCDSGFYPIGGVCSNGPLPQ